MVCVGPNHWNLYILTDRAKEWTLPYVYGKKKILKFEGSLSWIIWIEILVRERQRNFQRDGKVAVWPQTQRWVWCDHTREFLQLLEAGRGKKLSSRAFAGRVPCQHLEFILLVSITGREYISIVLSPQVCGHFYGCHGKLTHFPRPFLRK